jgi:hypothetical protein
VIVERQQQEKRDRKGIYLNNKREKYSEPLWGYAGKYVEWQHKPEFPVLAALNNIASIELCRRVQVGRGVNDHTILSIRPLIFSQEPCCSWAFRQPERRHKRNTNGASSLNDKKILPTVQTTIDFKASVRNNAPKSSSDGVAAVK